MRLTVTEDHKGEGEFPTFSVGSTITNIAPCKKFKNWVEGTVEQYTTYFPTDYIKNDKLICNYNPTELIARQGSAVNLLQVVYEWALVENETGAIGWLPFEKLRSLDEN
ncbi:hypothetical protein [Paenibacillus senegalimassiliensis]|uniref:hypothetical protein n=1 Tax=Paenibacillus senegalimassiliensis TaxID=1737426 RepID=UPI00073F658E|nr:hypothetical protein [Paenibacillus senegalimassiliensis]